MSGHCRDCGNQHCICDMVNENHLLPHGALRDILGIAKQEVYVYQVYCGCWSFANAGIISDGFKSKKDAEIAALKAILDAVISTIEAENVT